MDSLGVTVFKITNVKYLLMIPNKYFNFIEFEIRSLLFFLYL